MICPASRPTLLTLNGVVHFGAGGHFSENVMKRTRPTITNERVAGNIGVRWKMSDSNIVLTASTKKFMAMAYDSQDRNRAVDIDEVYPRIDPEGIHIVAFHMMHNDSEFRTLWMVKMKDSLDPVSVWVDCSYESFNKNTQILDLSEIRGKPTCFS